MNPAPVESRFDSYADYRQAFAQLLALAQDRIGIFDPDLKETGLESVQGVEALTRFLAGRRDARLRIVVHDTDFLERYCPRLQNLMRLRGHAIEIRRTPDDLRQLTDCFALADAKHALIRFHADHARGKLLVHQEQEVGNWQRRFDELWDLAVPAAGPTTLGL